MPRKRKERPRAPEQRSESKDDSNSRYSRGCDRAEARRKCILHYSSKTGGKKPERNENHIGMRHGARAREQFNFGKFVAKISRLRSCAVLRDELHPADFRDDTVRSYYRVLRFCLIDFEGITRGSNVIAMHLSQKLGSDIRAGNRHSCRGDDSAGVPLEIEQRLLESNIVRR